MPVEGQDWNFVMFELDSESYNVVCVGFVLTDCWCPVLLAAFHLSMNMTAI